jgi:hypothetical protein
VAQWFLLSLCLRHLAQVIIFANHLFSNLISFLHPWNPRYLPQDTKSLSLCLTYVELHSCVSDFVSYVLDVGACYHVKSKLCFCMLSHHQLGRVLVVQVMGIGLYFDNALRGTVSFSRLDL